MNDPGQLGSRRKMLRLAVLLLLCVLPLLGSTLASEEIPGFVIGWGINVNGEATGKPSMEFIGTELRVPDSVFAVGTVVIGESVLSNAVEVAAGMGHSLARRVDGSVVGWGGNESAQAVGHPTAYPHQANGVVQIDAAALENVSAIAAGRTESVALSTDGKVVVWGHTAEVGLSRLPRELTNVLAIAAGGGFASYGLALRRDGTVCAWGSVNPPPVDLRNVVEIAASRDYSPVVALTADGTVREWPVRGTRLASQVPQGLSNVVSIAAGGGQRLALRSDGTIMGWGFNGSGQATGVPTKEFPCEASGLVSIDGAVVSNVVAVAAGLNHSLALKGDGMLVAWGRLNNGLAPVTVPDGLRNVVAIACGDNHCLAVTTNAAVAAHFKQRSAPAVPTD